MTGVGGSGIRAGTERTGSQGGMSTWRRADPHCSSCCSKSLQPFQDHRTQMNSGLRRGPEGGGALAGWSEMGRKGPVQCEKYFLEDRVVGGWSGSLLGSLEQPQVPARQGRYQGTSRPTETDGFLPVPRPGAVIPAPKTKLS